MIHRNKIYDSVLEHKITCLLKLQLNYSYEGGFELEKTDAWINLLNLDPKNDIHKYQGSRQLRFTIENDDNITGAHCKDNITLFTDEELDMICMLINESIDKLN